MLKNSGVDNVGDVFVSVRSVSADNEIMQNALGSVEVAFSGNESANSGAIKVMTIGGKNLLKFKNFKVDAFAPSFRNGRVKSSLFFKFF